MSLTARTESVTDGSLNYPVTFQVRESAGVAATVSTVTITLSGAGGTGTATMSGM